MMISAAMESTKRRPDLQQLDDFATLLAHYTTAKQGTQVYTGGMAQ